MKLTLRFPLLFVFAAAATLHAQSNGGNNANSATRAALNLPRIKVSGKSDDNSVARGRATVHELAPNGRTTARRGNDQKIDYLAIEGGTAWSSPIRGATRDTTFVSFFLLAAAGTSIDVAGAKLLVRAGTAPDTVQLQLGRPGKSGMQWRNFGGPIRLERYGGAQLAALPVLTARLDGSAGIWDLFVGSRLGAADLPLRAIPADAAREFRVHAGAQGVRLCGLISSDDNPLFADENRNGIEDGFERQKAGGKLLNLSGQVRSMLAHEAQQDQQARKVATQAWTVRRPRPDNAPADPPAKKKQ